MMMVEGVGVSSSPQVVLGRHEVDAAGRRHRWLYYAAYDTMEYHLARVPFTEDELKQWKETLEARRDWLAARGCRYVFVIAPNSQSIYPEFLPDEYQRVGRRSRADELIDYLRQHSTIDVIDTREPLIAARRDRPELRTYHRTDTHWNDEGSFIAYRQMAQRLAKHVPAIKPLERDQFESVVRITEGGDLAGVLGIKDHFQEERLDLEFKPPLVRRVPRERYDDRVFISENPAAASLGLPTLVMFRDSFGSTLKPFLAEHFGKSVFVWSDQFHPEYIEEHMPQIVITQMVERFFWRKPPVK
jgi:alginate O-acetyltransferase complex protein AlgJ